jgi:hypothetical protein
MNLRVAIRFGFLLSFGAGLASACAVRHIDLGVTGVDDPSLDPRANAATPLPPAYGCGDWIDQELNALRAGSCNGLCTSSPASPPNLYDLRDKPSMMAATAGRWTFCSGHLGPDGAEGMEFGPGCRIFFLRFDDAGVATRGTEAAWQADYDIFDPRPEDAPARIDLHWSATDTTTFGVVAYRCPERLVLRSGDLVVELARFDGNGGSVSQVH